ncbi:2-polyprenyl-6-methoxyphenol hydroxylase-like FAD-dependent oxidoreductase [Plasticicumulans lactativorans]|uniref:2-polyprenyl-6-methoxyphenol hydroxylase-like FAD-dependent oxidoreductase n=1 Tax=Plasticicumulans lactativorans TaxID=1133106 RepID=A0A4R2LGD7_9GAMM|nr:FAD-dependent oxidoreductase [Plasticicumulans lactativorans]TCO83801.1 2-polyprenyl-6-methoxyphenol hydroxylase-like FAD-dependent oxidoreductase [Plasticicumulans lactativorans]
MNTATDVDVLVVGAGPTGLMLANQLARRGVRVQVVERNAGPSRQTKALGVQARTLEIYARLGVVERALAWGTRAIAASLWVEGRPAARVPLGDIGHDLSPYPFLLILGQDDNERLLGDELRARGVEVQWGTELVGLTQDAERATATLRQADGTTRELTAAWVAGCDGAHSTVRRLSGIDFPGAPYEQVFFVADTRVSGPMAAGELNVYLWPSGFHLFFPMRGSDHWRVVGIVPPALRGHDDLDFDALLPALRQEVGAGLAFQACTWFSTYRIHHRRAARFRERRCFLLGDAAHIHSPVGAQGMNTGLQDAYNLAWKLALVSHGHAAAGLLDSYEAERIPVAERLLRTTDRAFSIVVSNRWLAGLLRMRVLPKLLALAMRGERTRRLAFRTISQTGIRYPDSALSQDLAAPPGHAPRAGDRFPWLRLAFAADGAAEDLYARLDDTRFHLLLVGQAAPPGLPDALDGQLDVHVIPEHPHNAQALDRARIPRPAFYLLRPDGHVGLAGTRLDAAALRRYLAERLQLQPRTP